MFVYRIIVRFISPGAFLFFCSFVGHAQLSNQAEVSLNLSIPPVALINFATNESQQVTYTYSPSGPDQVEQVVTPTSGDKTWLNYSSVVEQGTSNYITAYLSSGSLPADVSLNVLVGADEGAGAGAKGRSLGQITLTTYPQNVITNIGSCFTGIGVHKGHKLTYIWDNPESYNYNYYYESGNQVAVTYVRLQNKLQKYGLISCV